MQKSCQIKTFTLLGFITIISNFDPIKFHNTPNMIRSVFTSKENVKNNHMYFCFAYNEWMKKKERKIIFDL